MLRGQRLAYEEAQRAAAEAAKRAELAALRREAAAYMIQNRCVCTGAHIIPQPCAVHIAEMSQCLVLAVGLSCRTGCVPHIALHPASFTHVCLSCSCSCCCRWKVWKKAKAAAAKAAAKGKGGKGGKGGKAGAAAATSPKKKTKGK